MQVPPQKTGSLGKVNGEFNLVFMALNLRRMAQMIRWM
jgi:hypothetical protein